MVNNWILYGSILVSIKIKMQKQVGTYPTMDPNKVEMTDYHLLINGLVIHA